MFKGVFIFAVILFNYSFAEAQSKKTVQKKKWITVSGKVAFLNDVEWLQKPGFHNKVIWGKGVGRRFVPIDSVLVKPDGSYSFRLDATVPSFYRIDLVYWDNLEVFADVNMVINVQGFDTSMYKRRSIRFHHIQSNSINNKILNIISNYNYWAYQQAVDDAAQNYYAEQYKAKDSAWLTYLKKQKLEGQVVKSQAEKMFTLLLKDFPDKPVTLKLVEKLNWRKDTTEAMTILDRLIKKFPWFAEAKKMKSDITDYIVRSQMLEIGKPSPVFAYPDPEGTIIDFASYRGKYVLIDFWASWCGPCRKALPKVKAQHALYKDKGLEVLAVSIDENKDAWLKAVEDEKMPWKQVLSPNMDQTMKDFMFTGIPTLYLIDPKGNIVDRYTGYSLDLEDKLQQIFANIKNAL